MSPLEVTNFCLAGTNAYLAFLEANANNTGVQRISVARIEQIGLPDERTFKLIASYPLFDPDSVGLVVAPDQQPFGPADFRTVEYDPDSKALLVQVLNPELRLEIALARQLTIISDMKFLVRNVRNWFEANGFKLKLPNPVAMPASGNHPPSGPPSTNTLDSSQTAAVSSVLQESMSYIWGPPGTGKTRSVLVRAVLKLIQEGKRVGVFAPTNNALEQAMTAVLEAAKDVPGLAEDKFLRVGTPSQRFASRFPDACEIQGLASRIQELQRQIRVYDTVLHVRRGPSVLSSLEFLRLELNSLSESMKQRTGLLEQLGEVRKKPLIRMLKAFTGETQALEKRLEEVERSINGKMEAIRRTRTNSDRLNRIINGLNLTSREFTEQELSEFERKARQFLENNRALAQEHEQKPTESIESAKAGLQTQVESLRRQSAEDRINRSLVAGMTLDAFIGRFVETSLPFAHQFVDEAGYVPLVKALTLFRNDVPVTLIGDHKQLGPICEMDDDNLAEESSSAAIVWKKSALFSEEVFAARDAADLMEKLQKTEPQYGRLACARLSRTFRFGQNLAEILARQVYDGLPLISASQNHLQVEFIDAVLNQHPEQTRENRVEAEAIRRILEANPEWQSGGEEALAILSPYKKQVALLGQLLPEQRAGGRILTVHKAQGREWNTVIISLVDGRFNLPWFTDTLHDESGGLFVMNTAVSRARVRLVIVGDRNFWLNYQNNDRQLISELARHAGSEGSETQAVGI